MLKETGYKEKFVILAPWMPEIVDSIKKNIKTEHLRADAGFVKRYFSGKNINKLTTEELAEAYTDAMANAESVDDLGEFITNRWLLKHGELYNYFEHELSKVNPNFSEIDSIDEGVAMSIMEGSVHQFGAPATYLFCVLNSVVFPKKVYSILEQRAKDTKEKSIVDVETRNETLKAQSVEQNYQLQISRLTDKYEKKISGLEKKYITDVALLKKQVANLQRKLNITA